MALGEILATASLVMAASVALWLVFNDRLNAAAAESFTSRLDVNKLRGRLAVIERTVATIQVDQANCKLMLEGALGRLDPLEKMSGPTDAAWNELILAVARTIEVVHARLEWHLSWLERLTIASDALDHAGLLAGDAKLSARVVPRLFGMELCSLDSTVREGAAGSVADGVGDRENYAAMGRLMSTFPGLVEFEHRLGNRLLDAQADSGAARPDRNSKR